MKKQTFPRIGALPPRPDLASLGLVDSRPEEVFDHLTELAAHVVRAPVSLIAFVEPHSDRQFFKSQFGLGEPWASRQQTPLSHSFCQHVVAQNAPLAIGDARTHPLVRENPAMPDLEVIAYLGIPVTDARGAAVGALCAIDREPREWSGQDVASLSKLARCVSDQIALRTAQVAGEDLRAALHAEIDRMNTYHSTVESVVWAFISPELRMRDRLRSVLRTGRRALGTDLGALCRFEGSETVVLATDGEGVRVPEGWGQPLTGSLDSLVAERRRQIERHDLVTATPLGLCDAAGRVAGCYIGAPVTVRGRLFGTLSFSSPSPRAEPWREEEATLMSMIALTVATSLALHPDGQPITPEA